MAKTMRRIVTLCIAFIAIALAAAAFVVFGGSCAASSESPLSGLRVSALNGIIDASGVKERAESALRARASAIAEESGIPQSMVNQAIDGLDIQNWEVTELPDDATPTGTHSFQSDDLSATVTTYDRNDIVTVDAYGQSLCFAVPESAQSYLALMSMLG